MSDRPETAKTVEPANEPANEQGGKEQGNEQCNTEPAKAYVYREGDVVPPDVVKVLVHRSVRVLPREAFAGRRRLEEIELPEGLHTVGRRAFCDCRSLRTINFPSSLVAIGAYAFAGCRSLKSLPLAEGLRRIGKSALLCCDALERLDVPGSVSSIGAAAFYACSSLKEVTIKEGIVTVEEDAFRDCPSLERIGIPSPTLVFERAASRDPGRGFDCRLVTGGSLSHWEGEGVSIICPGCLASISNLSEVQDQINAIMNRHGPIPASRTDEQRREEDLDTVRKLITYRVSLETQPVPLQGRGGVHHRLELYGLHPQPVGSAKVSTLRAACPAWRPRGRPSSAWTASPPSPHPLAGVPGRQAAEGGGPRDCSQVNYLQGDHGSVDKDLMVREGWMNGGEGECWE